MNVDSGLLLSYMASLHLNDPGRAGIGYPHIYRKLLLRDVKYVKVLLLCSTYKRCLAIYG